MGVLPEVMPAAVYRRPGEVVVEERPVPRPGPGEVLVEVDHCGICGSDIHILLDGWGDKPGLVAGHEFTGIGGRPRRGRAGLGDRRGGGRRHVAQVRAVPAVPRGEAVAVREPPGLRSIDGHNGAFARYLLVRDARRSCGCPPGLSARQAALAEPLAVALHGITRSGVAPGDSVMVIGAGPIGALSIAALVARGHRARSPPSSPESGASSWPPTSGPTEVLDPAELEKFPPWEPERISERAVHVVLECSGKKEAMEAGFHQLRRGGTLALVGAGIEHPAFDPNRFILNELHVVGLVHLRQGRVRAGPGAAGLRRVPDRPAHRGGGRAPRRHLGRPGRPGRGPLRRQGDGGPPAVRRSPAAGDRSEVHDDPPLLPDRQPTVQPRGHEPARPTCSTRRNRTDICRFWSEVFGFDEIEVMTEDRRRLILSCVHWDQFIFLIAEDDPMRCPADGPLRVRGRIAGRAPGGAGPGRRPFGSTTTGSTSSTCTRTTRRWSRSTRSTSSTCCR